MERLLFIWDELDDLVGLAKHFGRNVSGDARASWRGATASLRGKNAATAHPGLKFGGAAPNLPRR